MGETPSLPLTKTLVRGARQLLTLRGPVGPRRGTAMASLGIVPDGAVLIRGGRILEAGPSRRLENLSVARGAAEINAAGRVVMPGFVDSRTHPVSAPVLPVRRMEARAQSALDSMARHGTTTVAASVSSGMQPTEVLTVLRMLTGLNGRPLDVIPEYYVADAETVRTDELPLLARRKLAQLISVNCRPHDEIVMRRILDQAHHLGLRATVCAQSPGCVVLAVEMQAAAVVLQRMDPAVLPDLSLPRPVCTLVPPSIYRRQDYPPARALLEAGAAVALASGFGFEQCPTYNMQMVISLACSEMGMSPAEAISAATINGAHTVARGHLCGSIEPSKMADLLLLNVADYRELPAQFGVNHVHMVLKNGHVVYREGEVTSWTGE